MKNKMGLVIAALSASTLLMAEDTFRIQLGGQIVADQSTEVSYGTSSTSATLSIEDFFGMKTDNQVFRLDSYYRFNDEHRIEFAYYAINSSGTKTVDNDFTWGENNTISSGASVTSHFDVDMYKINYVYSFYHSDKVEIGIGAGLHVTGLDVGIDAQGTVNGTPGSSYSESASVTAPLPVLGFRLRYNITDKLEANFNYDFFALKIGDYKGNIQNSTLMFDYTVTDHFGIGAGLDLYSLSFQGDDGSKKLEIERTVNAGMLFISYHY